MTTQKEAMRRQIIEDLKKNRKQVIEDLGESRKQVGHLESESSRLKKELADVRAKKHELLKQRSLLVAIAIKLGIPQAQIAEILDRSRESVRRSMQQGNAEVEGEQ